MKGKVLACRCEDVTMHELHEAIARGHDDVESLKRYTGFGTGWCQGKWCLALCARELAQRGGDAVQPFTPRPPFHPVALAHLVAIGDEPARRHEAAPRDYVNVLELDEDRLVLNAKNAEKYAAQSIPRYVTAKPVEPPFEEWEVELPDPPPPKDRKP